MQAAAAFLAMVVVTATVAPARSEVHETFTTTPFGPTAPRWCERYHHAHWVGGAVRLTRSRPEASECGVAGDRAARSCREPGCDACGTAGSPCAKVGDPLGNAVIETVRDDPGIRRTVTARFAIERPLPLAESHLAVYAALHPHCHTTVQAILVPDRPGAYHLNVAAFNQFIGGDRRRYRVCLDHPMHEISPPLARDVVLAEGRPYVWTLTTELDRTGRLVASSTVVDDAGARLASGRYTFTAGDVRGWFGVAGAAARYGFGAQLGRDPADPALRLLRFDAASR